MLAVIALASQALGSTRVNRGTTLLRTQVFLRDRGVCAQCGIETEALRKNKRKLDYNARRQFERDWGRRRHLWDADHNLPVAEGGSGCDLANMRTLCLKCHRAATLALLKRRAGARLASVVTSCLGGTS
jgi:5-methylcytosine-specific restriction endonuclease McrA